MSNGCAKEQNTVRVCSYNLNITFWLSSHLSLEQPWNGFRRWGQFLMRSCPCAHHKPVAAHPIPFIAPLVSALGPSFSLVRSDGEHVFFVGSLCSERRYRQDLCNCFQLVPHILLAETELLGLASDLQPAKLIR